MLAQVPEALHIHVSCSRDGDGFAVDVDSRRWLREQFPEVRVLPRLYVGHTARRDLEPQLRDIKEHIVSLLIGVPTERLAGHGVRRISFVDPITDAEVEGLPLAV